MMINVETVQLLAGISKHIFQDTQHLPYLPTGWVTSLREFLDYSEAAIDITDPWIPPLQRVDDDYLMEKVMLYYWTKAEMMKFQMCRLYLQVYSLADIIEVSG